jgi:hypothetical protein
MATVNPDLHGGGYQFVPTNRITSVLATSADVRQALTDLGALGFVGASVELFVGEEGADVLDLPAEHHGTTARTIRNMEAIMVVEAGDSHRRADEALRSGGAVIAVVMDGKEDQKDAVVAVLHRSNAWLVRYWGRWAIESFD